MKNPVSRNSRKLLLGAAFLSLLPLSAHAADDVVDLLSYDKIPSERPLQAEPDPVPAEAPPLTVVTPAPEEKPALVPVADTAAKPTPPVETKAVKPVPKKQPVVKKTAPKPEPVAAIPEVKKEPAPVVTAPVVEPPKVTEPVAPPVAVQPVPVVASHPIEAGQSLRIVVEGEAELSGTYIVKPDGMVTLPLVGEVRAGGFTPEKLAEILTATLKDGYLVDPKIAIEPVAAPKPEKAH